jgi:hypothetical protein
MSLDRDNLEDWLTEHPEAKDDLTDLLHLRAVYQSVWPPEPSEGSWNVVQSHVHESIAHRRSLRDRWPRWRWALTGLAAASVLLGGLLARSLWTTHAPNSVPEALVEEPFPVVEPDEVTIIAMDASDVGSLVVAEPPVSGDLVFARPEDIHVIHCERCPFCGGLARLEQEGEVPMFVSAAAVEAPDDDKE